MLLKIQHQQGFNTDDFFVCTNKWKQAKQTLNLDFFFPLFLTLVSGQNFSIIISNVKKRKKAKS